MKIISLKSHFIILTVLSLVILSCGKKKTVEVKLHVQSETTGNPISNAAVELTYYKDKDSDGDLQTMELGVTDANGNIDVKDKIKGRSFDHNIRVFANGYGKIVSENLAIKIPFEPGKPTDQTIKLSPVYHYLVTLESISSFTPYDTVWITGSNGYSDMITGCPTGNNCPPFKLYYNDYPGFQMSNWFVSPQITLNLKVRRATSVTNTSYNFTLTEGVITPIEINF